DWNNPGIVVKGTDAQTGNPNTTNVSAEAYYQSLYQIQQKFVYSATYLKLRELRLAYDLTPSEAHLVLVRSVNIALVARNLLLSKRAPNIDPEFAYETTSAGLGVEYGALATATSWGLDVRIGF
ncbi:MAG: SusC/RagA family TonB-linked outer membrane protein, partial [Gemmatimonadaceae bacterium]